MRSFVVTLLLGCLAWPAIAGAQAPVNNIRLGYHQIASYDYRFWWIGLERELPGWQSVAVHKARAL